MENNNPNTNDRYYMTEHAEVFPDVLSIFDYLKEQWKGMPCHTSPYFEVMSMSENRLAEVPMPIGPLWRGESEYHNPCLPFLYRGNWTDLKELERQIQLEDFRLILQDNPEIKEMEDEGLEVNYTGLAQHYGIETQVLDLTNSFLVAAFFATTTFDPVMDVYSPIMHTVSLGVIYFIPLGAFNSFLGAKPSIWPIGLNALRRPGEQRGYGMMMTEQNRDLNLYPGVHLYRFWHSPSASMKIWNETKGGSIFFPYDPMTEKVRNIRKYRIYSEEALRLACGRMEGLTMPLTEARHSLIKAGCTFVDKLPFAYTEKELVYLSELYKRKCPGESA